MIIAIIGANLSGKTKFSKRFLDKCNVFNTDEAYIGETSRTYQMRVEGKVSTTHGEIVLSDENKIAILTRLENFSDGDIILEGKRFFSPYVMEVLLDSYTPKDLVFVFIGYDEEVIEERFDKAGLVYSDYFANAEVAAYETYWRFKTLQSEVESKGFKAFFVDSTEFKGFKVVERKLDSLLKSPPSKKLGSKFLKKTVTKVMTGEQDTGIADIHDKIKEMNKEGLKLIEKKKAENKAKKAKKKGQR